MTELVGAWKLNDCVALGRSSVEVLPLGLGTHGHGHAFGGVKRETSQEIVVRACDSVPEGARVLIDVAPRYGYGLVEEWVGEVYPNVASKALVTSKGGRHIESDMENVKEFTGSFLRKDLEASLHRLGLDRIFLYQMHNPSLDEIRAGAFYVALDQFRDEGLIDWYGISIDTVAEGHAVLDQFERGRLPHLLSLQVIYSVLNKQGRAALFARAAILGVAILAREILVRGLLTPSSLPPNISGMPAVSKMIDMYGLDQLVRLRTEVLRACDRFELGLPSAAVSFARSTHGVSVSLVGCNSIDFFDEDWHNDPPLSIDELDAFGRLPDLEATSLR